MASIATKSPENNYVTHIRWETCCDVCYMYTTGWETSWWHYTCKPDHVNNTDTKFCAMASWYVEQDILFWIPMPSSSMLATKQNC